VLAFFDSGAAAKIGVLTENPAFSPIKLGGLEGDRVLLVGFV